ncbi:MAG: hypothetical protein GTN81_06465 [Proteobacteria bacterium]|nr:hypothetical protein [Pseudomonadota bacterium]
MRKALLAQVVEVGTDFSKRARWCGSSRGLFDVSSWVRRLAYGYSYVRSALSQEDRDTLDKWFLNGGNYFKDVLHETIARRFPKRLDDNYSTCASESFCPGKDRGLTHYGGYQTKNFQLAWNNQMAATAACLGAIAVLLDNGTLKSHAKRFVKEWLKYGVFPGGQIFDQMRWNTGYTPEHGYVYPGTAIGSIISIVDHLARAGDSELYEYSTSDGIYGTAGGSKSLLSVLRHFAGQTNGDVVEYASTGPASDPNLIIDTGSTNFNMVTFVVLAPANIYYKDPELKRAYKTPIPSTYHTGGYDPLGGDWGSYPSIRFMFGEREQIAWPYASSLMSAPEHFRIVKGQS